MKPKVLIVIVFLIAVSSFVLISSHKQVPLPKAPQDIIVQPTIDNSDLKLGGSSYGDPQGVYQFLYPSEYKIDEQNNGKQIRIYKIGATQKGQTEMYDGAIIVFEKVTLDGKSLSDWVDNNLDSIQKDGSFEITEPKKSITLNNYPGFSYSVRGLGEAKYIIIQKNTESNYAVLLSISVSDPQNVGFQKEVDKTLSTLEIFK